MAVTVLLYSSLDGSPLGLESSNCVCVPWSGKALHCDIQSLWIKPLLWNWGAWGFGKMTQLLWSSVFFFCKRVCLYLEVAEGFKITHECLAANSLLSAKHSPCPRHCHSYTKETSRILTWFLMWDWVSSQWKTPNSYCNSENEWTYESHQDALGTQESLQGVLAWKEWAHKGTQQWKQNRT